MPPNKILIIGISGTGKTTLGRKLSELLKIPLVHYDKFVWDKNWTEIDPKIVEKKLEEEVKKDKWIIEGYIQPAGKIRLERADLVIYLDYSGWRAALGGLKRWWQHRGRTRSEMAAGCIEKFNWDYLKVMWNRDERPEIEETIRGFENKIVRLKNKKELNSFLKKFIK